MAVKPDAWMQEGEGDCGYQSVLFACAMSGVMDKAPLVMERSEAEGTTHEAIVDGLERAGLRTEIHTGNIICPCIVNYLVADDDEIDGHYSVIIGLYDKEFWIMYDPADALIKLCRTDLFERVWKSFRYPPDKWSVRFFR